ncbi:MAG: STAS domain-containing protein [Firmicutes bacterium]|nr:STAS domain-containing protein [Bacillota bacterium]
MLEKQVSDLKVRRVLVNNINAVIVQGECDICSAQLLKDMLADVINEGHNKLIVDVKGLQCIDNSGLAAILWARHKIEENGGKMVVVGLGSIFRRKVSPINNLFNVAFSIREALWNLSDKSLGFK